MYLNLADLKGESVLKRGQAVVVTSKTGQYENSYRGVVAVHEPGDSPVLVNYQRDSSRVGVIRESDEVRLLPTPTIVRWWNIVRCVWPLGAKHPLEKPMYYPPASSK